MRTRSSTARLRSIRDGTDCERWPAEGRSDLDTEGCIIFAGFGDIHVHAREDVSGREMYKEDFATLGRGDSRGRDAFCGHAE